MQGKITGKGYISGKSRKESVSTFAHSRSPLKSFRSITKENLPFFHRYPTFPMPTKYQDLTVLYCGTFMLREVGLCQLKWLLWWLGIGVNKLCIQRYKPSSSHSPHNKAILVTFNKCLRCIPMFVLSVISDDIGRMHVDQILTSISVDLYNSQVTWLLTPSDTRTHYCVSSFYGWLGEKGRERRRQYTMPWYCKSIWDGQIAHKRRSQFIVLKFCHSRRLRSKVLLSAVPCGSEMARRSQAGIVHMHSKMGLQSISRDRALCRWCATTYL